MFEEFTFFKVCLTSAELEVYCIRHELLENKNYLKLILLSFMCLFNFMTCFCEISNDPNLIILTYGCIVIGLCLPSGLCVFFQLSW